MALDDNFWANFDALVKDLKKPKESDLKDSHEPFDGVPTPEEIDKVHDLIHDMMTSPRRYTVIIGVLAHEALIAKLAEAERMATECEAPKPMTKNEIHNMFRRATKAKPIRSRVTVRLPKEARNGDHQ